MEFEYDQKKSEMNKEKHGISFKEAKLLWNKSAVVIPAKSINEERYALISTLENRCYVAIFTIRDNKYRIISVRRCRKMRRTFMKTITAKEFDEKFDSNEDITEHLDTTKTIKTKKVNVDFPENILKLLDQEAKIIGVTRQSIIKMWIAERLKEEQKNRLVG